MDTENSRRRPRRRSFLKQKALDADIQYTQPKPFFRNRLIVQLLSVAAVVLAVTIGISIFFKVDTVLVTGASKYSAYTIAESAQIQKGESLLFFGRAKAAGRIKTALPYVDTVRFELKLPGTVNIIVEEKQVAYALQAEDGSWWIMTADGMIAEQISETMAQKHPSIEGVILKDPTVGTYAVAAEPQQTETVLTATAADRLAAAVEVLSQLEEVEMFSKVTCLDVTDLFALRLYCGDDCRFELGDTSAMAKKVAYLKEAWEQSGHKGGVWKLVLDNEQNILEVINQPWPHP